jgi:uncharacterized membrane protein (UPF0136 family)
MSVASTASSFVAITLLLLITIGDLQGWMNGTVRLVMISISCLGLVYVLVGRRLLQTFLESRATGRPHLS